MKKLLILLLCLPLLASAIRRYPGKNDGDGFYTVFGSGMVINPGDTVVLDAFVTPIRTYFAMIGYSGTALNPIVIVNENGAVTLTRGLGFESCRFIKVIGNTVPGVEYGIQLHGLREGIDIGAAQGVNITKKSSDIEIAYVSFRQGTYAVECKNDADCDMTINGWVLANMYFHHNKIRNTGSQGFYLGNTDPDNFDRGILCNGVTIFPKPSILRNFRLEYNDIDSTGRAGIQLSGHEGDTANIRFNNIKHSGTQLDVQQGANISLGGNTLANVYNNTLRNSYTWNISAFGVFYIDMQNNALDSTNWLYANQINPSFYPPFAIQPRPQKAIYGIDSTRFKITNNTFARSRIREMNISGAGDITIGNSPENTFFRQPGNCVVGNLYIVPEPDVAASLFFDAGIIFSTAQCTIGPYVRTYNACNCVILK